jgi:hypothetical protein
LRPPPVVELGKPEVGVRVIVRLRVKVEV